MEECCYGCKLVPENRNLETVKCVVENCKLYLCHQDGEERCSFWKGCGRCGEPICKYHLWYCFMCDSFRCPDCVAFVTMDPNKKMCNVCYQCSELDVDPEQIVYDPPFRVSPIFENKTFEERLKIVYLDDSTPEENRKRYCYNICVKEFQKYLSEKSIRKRKFEPKAENIELSGRSFISSNYESPDETHYQ